jgi:putative ABC transport system permease protein
VVGEQTVPAVGLGHGEAGTSIPVIEGRAPSSADEVVLGRTTLHSLHTHVGGSIEVAGPDPARPLTLRVVGVGIFARFAPYPSSEPSGLGVGAALTLDGLTALGQEGGTGNTFFLASAAPGHRLEPSKLETDLFAGDLIQGSTFDRQRPVEVRGYAQMRAMPRLLVAVLGILLLGALAHLLATTTLRRDRDLAVLRAIGFTRGQVKRTLLVQLIVVLAVVTVVALPVGVIAGGWTWRLTARWLGTADDTAFPIAALAAMMAMVATCCVVFAVMLGQRAARRPVQRILIAD